MIPDRLALAITRMLAARGITPCVGVRVDGTMWAALLRGGLIYVASGPSITHLDLLSSTPLDVEALPAHQRRWIQAAVDSLAVHVRQGGQLVAVEA